MSDRRGSRRWIGWCGPVLGVAFSIGVLCWPVDVRRAALSPTLLADQGELLRAYPAPDDQIRLPLTVARVDPLFITMLVAYEDRRFYHHPGFDPLALGRAAYQWLRYGDIVSGGSTLTMQVARLLSPAPRTIGTKLQEIVRAMRLEAQYSKTDILNFYLVLAPYGGNITGLRAASLVYFDKEPQRLTPDEAALLVVLPQNPNRWRPDRYPQHARAARDKVLRRLHQQHVISDTAFAAGRAQTLGTRRYPLPMSGLHLADRLRKQSPHDAPWHSTLDKTLQARVEEALRNRLSGLASQATLAALVIDNRTHQVKAYVGNAAYFDNSRAGQVDLVPAIRSPGSTLKPFLYGIAFQDGLAQPETIIRDMPVRFGTYTPSNFNQGYQGDVSMREALQQSLNIPVVKILDKVGVARWLETMRATGTRLTLPAGAASADLPIILGGLGSSLWDLTQLYTGLANGGRMMPVSFRQDTPRQRGYPLLNAKSAWQVTHILTGSALNEGTMRGPGLSQLAIKTGTSYGYRDAWAMGYTPRYTVGIWAGRADGSPSPGQVGRNTAIPVLLDVYDLLPAAQGRWPASPAGALTRHADLPPNLQRWVGDRPSAANPRQRNAVPFGMTYPVSGSVFRFADISERGIKLMAQGGVRPYQWYVNGTLFNTDHVTQQAIWSCPGPGRYKITLQDQNGLTRTSVMDVVK